MDLASSNTASLLDMSVRLRLMEAGNFLMMLGVVELAVDIHRPVVRLSVWTVALCVQIQRHIQKICYLEVCLDGNPQPLLPKNPDHVFPDLIRLRCPETLFISHEHANFLFSVFSVVQGEAKTPKIMGCCRAIFAFLQALKIGTFRGK